MTINWLGNQIKVTQVNGFDKKLAAVARELQKVPVKYRRYFAALGGTFN